MRPATSDRYDMIVEVQKFNPFHDALGRFASANGFKTYSANIYSKAGAKAVVRSAMYGHGSTKNVHASSAGTVGSDYSIANDTYTAASKNPKPKTKKPKTAASEEDPTDKWRPDWMPENHRRNHEKQDRHLAGTNEGWEAVQDQTGCSEEEAKAMHSSVRSFSGSSYEAIRKYAYEGPPPSDRKADAENIEKFISSSPQWEDGPLYRGISVEPAVAKQILAEAKAGKAIGQRGPASWSTDRDTADAFAMKDHPTDISIVFCTGGRQNGTSIKHLSKFSYENEVLMSNDARWRATADPVEISPGVWEIVCEAIDVP